VVPPEDIEAVSQQFEAEYRASWIERKPRIDTSILQPGELVPTFMRQVKPFLDTHDLLRWQAIGEG